VVAVVVRAARVTQARALAAGASGTVIKDVRAAAPVACTAQPVG